MPTYASPSTSKAARGSRATRQSRTRAPQVPAHRQPSPTAAFDDDPKWKLFITLNSKICAWDNKGCEPIFTSSSRGIVAAKRAQDGSLLAIADAQVVMLHQIKDGQDKSYRLKGTQRCRLLQYSHDSRHLFYTDSLHNSVQSYSISENRVVDAAKAHSSPITAFAVSCDSNLILSGSANPPTVQIYNQVLATTVSLAPSCSSAPVVSCAFHPNRKSLFLLAFGDGVLAAFDYTKLPIAKNDKKENAGLGVVRCHARGIHAFRHLHDPSIAGSSGITGAEFVPGQRSRAVTVGEDGRCFLVDFEKGDTVGSWHIGAPATGLTIREIAAGTDNRKEELGGYLISIGTVHGRCLVYDGNGNKVAERIVDTNGENVIDVEWVYGDVNLPDGDLLVTPEPDSPLRKAAFDRSPRTRTRFSKSARPLTIQDPNPVPDSSLPIADDVILSPSTETEPAGQRGARIFSPPVYDPLEEAADQGYMNLFSPVKRKRPAKSASLPEKKAENAVRSSDPRVRASEQGSDHRSAISAPQLWEDKVPDLAPPKPKEHGQQKVAVQDVFQAFQTDEQNKTPTDEMTGRSSSQGTSVFEGVSTVVGGSKQVKVDERTDDGRILSEIKSIRALFSGKSTSSSSSNVIAPPPATKMPPPGAKSTPIGGPTEPREILVRKANSAPGAGIKRSPKDIHTSDETGASQPPPLSITKTTSSATKKTILSGNLPISESTYEPAEAPTEEEEQEQDIWLAQTMNSRAARRLDRKRKKVADESSLHSPVRETTLDLSRSTSTSRSSKSRKTVSWSDTPHPATDGIQPTPMLSSSLLMPSEFSENVDQSLQPSPMFANPNTQIDTSRRSDSPQTSLRKTSSGVNPPESPTNAVGQTIEDIVKAALASMQTAMLQQMHEMRADMTKQFQDQNAALEGLRSEMLLVREENQKLRSMLFSRSGVRDTVRDSISKRSTTPSWPSSPTQ
ncbi:Similar to hypothetical protein [Tuber melanosporum Mel28]; acc. no. XP_002837631 [Pyronema omphalodes CBS 100304]|uniref:Uncharacterized protein n=1 Tax=Pyronema omphalodes (strain CBS 100304) TaxID=1076935 RepID=U4LA10_PYROM|nr:Similar to hypothetical protein [Tuber melanosporum Mel28]; acc. no. XP_002837631 [Pyronema omphalodes CBS 100304]